MTRPAESPPPVLRIRGQDPGVTEEYPTSMAARIVTRFEAPSPVEVFDFPEKGNINQHTFLIESGPVGKRQTYILQRINQQVFVRPRSVMAAMIASLEAQAESLSTRSLGDDREWRPIELVPTREGRYFLEFENRLGTTYWRLMVKIPQCRTYKSLSEIEDSAERLLVAEEAGRGLAIYSDLTARMKTESLENPLPGYRDTRLYFNQLRSVLRGNRTLEDAGALLPTDSTVKNSTQQHFLVHLTGSEYRKRMESPELQRFIELARREERFAMTLLEGMERGQIRRVAIHGDTKLDNFLFDSQTNRVKALVDLDTIMPHTWLADWGDMVRSLSNVAGEKEEDLAGIQVDQDIYRAVAEGFLTTAQSVTHQETQLMAEAVEIIALELGIRFLADYLRGDSYFKLSSTDPPSLNKVRAMAQLTLFERLREKRNWAKRCLEQFEKN